MTVVQVQHRQRGADKSVTVGPLTLSGSVNPVGQAAVPGKLRARNPQPAHNSAIGVDIPSYEMAKETP